MAFSFLSMWTDDLRFEHGHKTNSSHISGPHFFLTTRPEEHFKQHVAQTAHLREAFKSYMADVVLIL